MTAQPPLDRQPDAALLARFAGLRDEVAFAELMRRHGPLVLAVCWRLLRQRQDAEDAFQAVFLALAKQARPLRRVRSLGGWLHNVAVRVSSNLRRANRRHHERMASLRERRQDSPANPLTELHDVLDEELTALPARYREVIVLCDLEGHSREEAARRLAAPVGTIGTWLSRGRSKLKDRLQRRGVTLAVGGLASALAHLAEASPAPSVELSRQTLHNAQLFVAGTGEGGIAVAAKISSLAQGVLTTMFLTRLSTTVCILALAAALVLGATPVSRMLGLASNARAQSYFADGFEDGDVSDGVPVRWLAGTYANGTSQAIAGDYVLGGTAISRYADGSADFRDGSVQTQLRFLQSIDSTIAYVFARSPTAAAYAGGIQQDGLLTILETLDDGSIQIHAQTDTALNPVTRDVLLQFDLVGNRISLTAWHDGEAVPSQPQLVVSDDTLTFGEVGIGIGNGGGVSQVAFRQVASVPEPSTAALGSLGIVALAAFGIRNRLQRCRRRV